MNHDHDFHQDSHLNVLAVIEEARTARSCLTVAAMACRVDPNASLTVLHVEVDPSRIFTAPEEISIQHLRTKIEGTAQERAMQAHQAFDQWVSFSGCQSARWIQMTGMVEETLRREAGFADLVAVARPHNLDSGDALHGAIFDTGKLVLFVPEPASRRQVFNDHVAIVWRPNAATRRALHHAMPWIRAASRVTVLCDDEANPAAEAAEMLRAEGVMPIIRQCRVVSGEHLGARVLRESSEIHADVLVVGAFRFGMILEWMFDGMTHRILSDTELPVLLMH